MITALGIAQILGWGSSFYLPAVFAGPIVAETGWSLAWVVGGASIGFLVAGLISPRVGRLIDRHGGRPVLTASSLFYALGLAGIGASPALPIYLIAWIVLGAGMGSGLYDAVFAALGRLYGSDARGPITNLTLFGGFASTVCWPFSAFLIEALGWRSACFVYAAMHLALALPLQRLAMREPAPVRAAAPPPAARPAAHSRLPRERLLVALLAFVLSIAAGIGSIVVVHLMIFLQAKGADFALAVSLGTLLGPAQVGARVVERMFGHRYHPLWTMAAAVALMALGLALLFADAPALAAIILLYGAGYGISWIARGTLPLALFGPERFPILMGRLALPSLVVQAAAPSAGAWCIELFGVPATLAALTVAALVNVALVGVLAMLCRAGRGKPTA